MNIDATPNQELAPPEAPEKRASFFQLLSWLFTAPSRFIGEIKPGAQPRFLVLLIWLLGVSNVLNQIDMKELLGVVSEFSSWKEVWMRAAFGAIVFGPIALAIQGVIYHLRAKFAGSEYNFLTSVYIALYSHIPIVIAGVAIKIYNTFLYGDAYFTRPVEIIDGFIELCITLPAIAYSIFLGYRGVIQVLGARIVASRVLFILVPGVFHLLVFTFMFAYAYTENSKGLDLNQEAIVLLNSGSFDAAEKRFIEALEEMRKDDRENIITIRENLVYLYLLKEDTVGSLRIYRDILNMHDSNSAEFSSCYGDIYLFQDNLSQAIESFELALQRDSMNMKANNNLGLLYLGELTDTIEDYDLALDYNRRAYESGGGPTLQRNLAISHYFLENYAKAEAMFDSLLFSDPGVPLDNFYLGLIYYSTGRTLRSKVFLKRAIRADSSLMSPDIRDLLAN